MPNEADYIDFIPEEEWEEGKLTEVQKETIEKREREDVQRRIKERKEHNEYLYSFSEFYRALEVERKKSNNKENKSPRFMGSRIFS